MIQHDQCGRAFGSRDFADAQVLHCTAAAVLQLHDVKESPGLLEICHHSVGGVYGLYLNKK